MSNSCPLLPVFHLEAPGNSSRPMPRSLSWKNTLVFLTVSNDVFFRQPRTECSKAKLTDGWTAAFTAGDSYNHAGLPQVKEISCPSEYEYELDSDFEDEDPSSVEPGVSSPQGEPSAKGGLFISILSVCAQELCIGKQPDGNTSSLSSFDFSRCQ